MIMASLEKYGNLDRLHLTLKLNVLRTFQNIATKNFQYISVRWWSLEPLLYTMFPIEVNVLAHVLTKYYKH